ncbi:MFS transporter [Henriciella mobilis]|uniref:spinster family MFS transporter n=1 Tax=Henriciella mobilis TaxID=2305467 RepID=UPI000E6745BA|nr:MFS transporter [Henriciella mobilis]RIJ16351.1 MFS transporter [Henriciella mobilis]RIJ22528.1 MFS transporter [Henriciella mobilis]
MTDTTAQQHQGHITGFGTKGYRTYVLLSLMLVYTLNFIDRTLISVVAQPIINEFQLNDTQWGLLSGPPFALFYALMGIPIAMWADRANRVIIITLCIIIWSVMTALCGIASGFIWLLIFRVGVAVGEAGCTPPANSLITDYYPPRSRAGALGIYSMGVTIGGVLAQLFGGLIAGIQGEDFGAWLGTIGLGGLFPGIDWSTVGGWRIAFVVVGLPGVVIALIILLTIKEPPRGYSDPPSLDSQTKAGFFDAFREFGKKPTFWWLSLGAALVAFVGYGLINFQAPFLQRVHGIGVRDAAVLYGAPLAAVAAGGTFLGGFLSERLEGRFPRVAAWLPGVGLLVSVPFYIAAFFAPTLSLAFMLWIVAAIAHYAYLGAQYTVGTAIVSPKSRATTISVLLLIVSLIGNGIGPLFVGAMSDFFMGMEINNAGLSSMAADFNPRLCSTDPTSLGETGPELCRAYANGLRYSMAATVLFMILAAASYFMAAVSFGRDRYRGDVPAAGMSV